MRGRTIKKFRYLRDRFLTEKFFFNRGKSLMSDLFELLTLTTIVGLFVGKLNSNFHTNIDEGTAMTLVIPLMLIYWILGRADAKKLHLIQKENEISTGFNPVIDKMAERIRKIDKNTRYSENKRIKFH